MMECLKNENFLKRGKKKDDLDYERALLFYRMTLNIENEINHKQIINESREIEKDNNAKRNVKYFKIVGNYRQGVLKFVVAEIRKLGYVYAPPNMDFSSISVFWSRSFGKHISELKPHQKVNFFPGMSIICRKDLLNQHIKEYINQYGVNYFDFWPLGFNLPSEYDQFVEEFKRNPSPYILKPPLAARGEGIRMLSSLDDIDRDDPYLKEKIPLAQKYIANPLLFHGKFKMTFRLYVAFTSVDPIRLYVYKNGLVRICSTPYQNDDYNNLLIHLTNWDLHKDNENEFEKEVTNQDNQTILRDGLRSDLTSIFNSLKEQGVDTDEIWKNIKELIAKTFLCVEKKLTALITKQVRYRGSAFELLGFDILIDENYKPWLLEINHTPSLSPHTELENKIKQEMIGDLLRLVDLTHQDSKELKLKSNEIYESLQK